MPSGVPVGVDAGGSGRGGVPGVVDAGGSGRGGCTSMPGWLYLNAGMAVPQCREGVSDSGKVSLIPGRCL